ALTSVALGTTSVWLARGSWACTFMKKAATPQYSVCFQPVNGWLWHWAHWSWTPRKTLVTESVTLSTVLLARKKVTAPFLSCGPEEVSTSLTSLSQGVLSLKFFSSHWVIGWKERRRTSEL